MRLRALCLLAICIGLCIYDSAPAETFTDGFEAPTLDSYWTTSTNNGSVGFSSSQVHSGAQSLQLATTNAAANKGAQVRHNFDTPVYGTASVWVYDSAADESSGNYIKFYLYNSLLGAPAGLFTQDFDLGPSNGGHYYYNAFNANSINTPVDRTKAWHLFEITSLPNLLELSIDGTIVHSGPIGTPFDAVVFEVHAPGFRPGMAVQYDDFQITVPSDNQPPVADAGADQTLECESSDGTLVFLDGTASSDPDGDELEYEWSAAEGSSVIFNDPTSATPSGLFPVGPTLVTLTVYDGNGGIDVDDVLITVIDSEPPVLVCTTDEIALWPPNHQMVPVEVNVVASDDCENPEDLDLVCEVMSSEPDDATGDGEFDGDVDGLDGYTAPVPLDLVYDPLTASFVGTVLLRAERDGADSGRVYSIVCDVVDTTGNAATSSCVVVVPHDRRKK